MTRSQKLEKYMFEMAKRISKKEKLEAERKAALVEIPSVSDLDYILENSKQYL